MATFDNFKTIGGNPQGKTGTKGKVRQPIPSPTTAAPLAKKPAALPETVRRPDLPEHVRQPDNGGVDEKADALNMRNMQMNRNGRALIRAGAEYDRTTPGAIGASQGGTGQTPENKWREWFKPANEREGLQGLGPEQLKARTAAGLTTNLGHPGALPTPGERPITIPGDAGVGYKNPDGTVDHAVDRRFQTPEKDLGHAGPANTAGAGPAPGSNRFATFTPARPQTAQATPAAAPAAVPHPATPTAPPAPPKPDPNAPAAAPAPSQIVTGTPIQPNARDAVPNPAQPLAATGAQGATGEPGTMAPAIDKATASPVGPDEAEGNGAEEKDPLQMTDEEWVAHANKGRDMAAPSSFDMSHPGGYGRPGRMPQMTGPGPATTNFQKKPDEV